MPDRYLATIAAATLALTVAAGEGTAATDERPLSPELERRVDAALEAAAAARREAHIGRLLRELQVAERASDQTVLMAALGSLELSAAEGVPIYTGLLDGPEVVSYGALAALTAYGDEASAALPGVIDVLRDRSRTSHVRAAAASALGVLGGASGEALDALVAYLREPGRSVKARTSGLGAIARFGPAARDARSLVAGYLDSPWSDVQYAAYRALGSIAPTTEAAAGSLVELVQASPERGFAALRAIQQQGDDGLRHAAEVAELVRREPRAYVRAMGIRTLAKIDAGGAAVAAALIDGVASGDELLAELAGDALRRLSTADASSVATLGEALAHPHDDVRFAAAEALARFGEAALPAVPRVVAALRQADGGTDHHQVGAYLDVLRAVGPPAREAALDLVVVLSGDELFAGRRDLHDMALRTYLLVTLAEIGVPSAALPAILSNLRSGMPPAFAAAARAAAALGPEAATAVPLRPMTSTAPKPSVRSLVVIGYSPMRRVAW